MDLAEILKGLPTERHPDLLLGVENWADAAIYRLSPEIAIVQTLDFFTPIVNDPYDFGRIAAANSLSDVYAMGGKPVTAMNICCFPVEKMDKAIFRDVLRGGVEVVHQAGAVLSGGHSVEDKELKYGLSVTGIVHPERFLTNGGAKPGDKLVLTKPLGTGILATALRSRKLDEKTILKITDLMAQLNKGAAEAMMDVGVNSATDISGFGLIGHSLEMAKSSKVCIRLYTGDLPVISEALTFLSKGTTNKGVQRNREFCSRHIDTASNIDKLMIDIISDAQTSGGLLISVAENKTAMLIQRLKDKNTPAASVIGEVLSGPAGTIQVR